MMRFGVALVACLTLFSAHSAALAYEWAYSSIPSSWDDGIRSRDAKIRSETAHSIGGSNHVQLEIALVQQVPSIGREPDRIAITTVPYRDAVFGSQTFRFRFDDGPWETREPQEPPISNISPPLYGLHVLDDGVIDRIRNAQRLNIEVVFRGYGVREFEFDIAGLQWAANPASDRRAE